MSVITSHGQCEATPSGINQHVRHICVNDRALRNTVAIIDILRSAPVRDGYGLRHIKKLDPVNDESRTHRVEREDATEDSPSMLP